MPSVLRYKLEKIRGIMYQKYKILAIIGARSGSQGLKDKNIHPFMGKPMIAYAIEAAKQSKYIDRVVVSTDSPTYAEISQKLGADVPFLRPAELSNGEATIGSFLEHAVQWLKNNEKQEYDFVISLPPTSPLRTVKQIDEAIEKYLSGLTNNQETLVSVYQAPLKIGWLLTNTSEKYIDFCFDVKKDAPQRQKLSRYYMPNGAIKICHVSNIKGDFYNNATMFYEMSLETSADIDTMEELIAAENIVKQK